MPCTRYVGNRDFYLAADIESDTWYEYTCSTNTTCPFAWSMGDVRKIFAKRKYVRLTVTNAKMYD